MKAMIVLGALALALPAAGQEAQWLPASQVFPGGDGAKASTLDAPLTALIAAHLQRSGRRRFAKRIVIHKARRRMDVFADGELLKSYVVNLGPAPHGPKTREGDGRTPEGELFVCSVNRVSRFTRFLALAYPAPADAIRGRAAHQISEAVAREIAAAWKGRDRCPPQTTALGGMVGIHGKGGWVHRGDAYGLDDWTLGCIGLRDADILELFEHYAEVGIPVQIHDD